MTSSAAKRASETRISTIARLSRMKRSSLALDHRPLYVSCYERFVRYASTTNIHGFLPLASMHKKNWFFRGLYVAMLFCGFACATYFITLEANNFNSDVVNIVNDYEQLTKHA